MNDATPRKFRGSLLERAAEVYPFALDPMRSAPLPPAEPEPAAVPPSEPAAYRDDVWATESPEPWIEPVPEIENPSLLATLRDKIALFRYRKSRSQVADNALESAEEDLLEPFSSNGAVSRKRLARKGLLVPAGPVTVLAEEFRMVKRHLLTTARVISATDAAGARMVLVCSARPNDGKTFCAVNLALSLAAEKDVEVLLVDADFVKPDLMNTLGLVGGRGLLDALADPAVDVENCIIRTDIPQLSVLPAGTPRNTDTELLASERARNILDGLAAANPRRIVIFDSPPALAASPASVLASHVGQVMLVVRAERTTESDLRETVQLLEACEHIQLVLNSVSFSPGGPRFGTYYGEERA